jgi:histidinol-phosphate aminotransferase
MNGKDGCSSSPMPSRRASELLLPDPSDFSIGPGVELIQLSRNESTIPLQPPWIEAAVRAMSTAAAYPDPECRALREAIAETFHLDDERIVCSAGLFECLQTIALTYLDPGDKVIVPEHAFPFFRQVAQLAGAEVMLVAERNLRVDVDTIVDAANDSTKMVIFANPGNPTGTYLCKPCIVEIRQRLPPATLLVIDEAYAEFVHEDRYEPVFDLTDAGNVIVLRSFSKMYGLAGFRVGWAYCPRAAVDSIRRVQVPVSISSIAQAIATLAVRDQSAVHFLKREMVRIRRRFIDGLMRLERVSPTDSEANFVLLRTRSETEARNLDHFLRQRGIVLRRQTDVGLGDCLRATIGTEKQMEFVASVIREWCGVAKEDDRGNETQGTRREQAASS